MMKTPPVHYDCDICECAPCVCTARDMAMLEPRAVPYSPPGAGPLRDALQAAIDAQPKKDRMGVALAMCVRALEILGKDAMLPAEKRIALANADVARDYIPDGVAKAFYHGRSVA